MEAALKNKWALFFLILMVMGYGTRINANEPESPVREDKGRILNLKEEMRIEDGQEDYYFKSPRGIEIGPDGSIFVLDDEQSLKFGPDGRFIKNLYKKGQGPGEFESISGLVITDDMLIVLQLQPDKFVLMTHDGKFLREFRPEIPAAKLIAVHDGRYITARSTDPKLDRVGDEPVLSDVFWTLGYVSEDGKVEEPDMQFPTRWYAKRIGGRALIADHIGDFIVKLYKDRFLIICHTEKYSLKIYDLDRNEVAREFGREYRRVRYGKDGSGRIEIRPAVFRPAPPVEHLNDIQQMFIRGDDIWVMTSTVDPRKGLLIDVFNIQGKYADSFYLPLKQAVKAEGLEDLPVAFQGDYMYIVEYDEDEIPSIVKYRMTQQP